MKWTRRRARGLFVLATFALMTAPSLVFASRTVEAGWASTAYLFGGYVMALGAVALVMVLLLSGADAHLPVSVGYVLMSAIVVFAGAMVLALDKDPTTFLATLVGVLTGSVITKLEGLMPRPRKGTRRRHPDSGRTRNASK